MAVEDWSTTAASNTTLGAIALGENAMSVNDINNAFREAMKQIADWRDGAIADLGDSGDYQPLDATLTALAGLTTAANKLPYATGSDTFSTTDFTAFGRTLVALASYSALRSALGAVTVTASSLANPGYIKFDISGTTLTLQWGTGSISGNSTGTINYPTAFTSFAVCVVSGGRNNGSTSGEGDVHVYTASGLTSQAIAYSTSGTGYYSWFAIGV